MQTLRFPSKTFQMLAHHWLTSSRRQVHPASWGCGCLTVLETSCLFIFAALSSQGTPSSFRNLGQLWGLGGGRG